MYNRGPCIDTVERPLTGTTCTTDLLGKCKKNPNSIKIQIYIALIYIYKLQMQTYIFIIYMYAILLSVCRYSIQNLNHVIQSSQPPGLQSHGHGLLQIAHAHVSTRHHHALRYSRRIIHSCVPYATPPAPSIHDLALDHLPWVPRVV